MTHPPCSLPSLGVAQEIEKELCALPDVHSLDSGRFGTIALLYPKHRVNGMRIVHTPTNPSTRFEIHVIVMPTACSHLHDLARTIRTITCGLLATDTIEHTYPIDVLFTNVADDAPLVATT